MGLAWVDFLVGGPSSPVITDGPTLSSAAAASCIPTANKITLPNNFWYPGKKLKIHLWGRITTPASTPMTSRFDVRVGAVVVAFDTAAFTVAVSKTTVPWWLDILLECRAQGAGTVTQLMGLAKFQSEAVVGSPAPGTGGNGSLLLPIGAPVLGTGFDNTAANFLDVFYTQAGTTASTLIVHDYGVEAIG